MGQLYIGDKENKNLGQITIGVDNRATSATSSIPTATASPHHRLTDPILPVLKLRL